PQLARRLTLGAAFATATTGMVLAPAVAADPAAPERGTGHAAISATLNPVSPMPAEGPGSPPADGDPVSDPPEPPAADPEPGHAATPATLNPVAPMPAEGAGSPPADGDPVSDPPEPPAADPEPGQADAGPSQRGAAPSGAEPDVPGRPALGWPGSGSAETPDEP